MEGTSVDHVLTRELEDVASAHAEERRAWRDSRWRWSGRRVRWCEASGRKSSRVTTILAYYVHGLRPEARSAASKSISAHGYPYRLPRKGKSTPEHAHGPTVQGHIHA